MYTLIDTEDADLCKKFLITQENNSTRALRELGRLPYPSGTQMDIHYLMGVAAISINSESDELRNIWNQFLSLMVTPRNDEFAIRKRYPWGVWRILRSGEIPDAPTLFRGSTINEADGLYQIHHYEQDLDGDE